MKEDNDDDDEYYYETDRWREESADVEDKPSTPR
jgi:hypothetical protein